MASAPAESLEADKPIIEPSKFGQFIALDGCPQFHQYEFDEEYARRRRSEREWKEAFEPLSLLLAKEGREFERRTRETLEATGVEIVDHGHIEDWTTSQSALRETFNEVAHRPAGGDPVFITQPRLGMTIEAWPVVGDADLLAVWPTADGIQLRIFEIKAAHEEKTYQQIQAACYSLLCRAFLDSLDPDYDWALEGGIIHRDTRITGATPEALPRFDLAPRENDVRRLLQAGGRFDTLWQATPEQVRYQLAPKCYGCAYKEACFSDAIEATSTALLGISQGEQRTLADHGVDTLTELAELAYPPTEPRPYEYDGLTPAQPATYDALLNEPGIGERLPRYIQQAQALLSELNEDSIYHPNTPARAPWIQGSGDGQLPEDDPPFDDPDLPIPRGSLIRVYLHVEWDHRRDRIIMVSAYLTASNLIAAGGEPRTISRLAREIPDPAPEQRAVERQILEDAITDIFDEIRAIAHEIGLEATAAFHLYFYSREERAVLVEALRRYDTAVLNAARDLLGLRGHITDSTTDQSMTSIIQAELDNRLALPIPNQGILPVKDLFQPTEDYFAHTDWTYTRPDGTSVDLREAFHHKLFDYAVPYTTTSDGIQLAPDDDPDGYYPSRARQAAHIPLEYIWAALEKLTEDWLEEIRDDYNAHQSIDPYRWVDADTQSTRIRPGDLEALGARLAKCVAHIERGIKYRNPTIQKHPLPLADLPDFSLGPGSIERALTEYLSLEYGAQRDDLLAHLSLPVEQRIRRGQSIPIVVESATTTSDGHLNVEAHLPYDQLFADGDRVAAACRQKGSQAATSGSWMIANELDRQGDPKHSARPHHLERGPGVTIEHLDIEERSITLSAFPSYTPHDREFTIRHRDWTTDPAAADDDTICFARENVYILDPRTDDLTAQRAYDLLDAPATNPICDLLEALATGRTINPQTDSFASDRLKPYLEWLQTDAPLSPNAAQLDFIRELDARIALLQGPPGTGKTSGALAQAILGRILASEGPSPFRGLATGESNKAVDELATAVADAYDALVDAPDAVTDRAGIESLTLVRLTSSPPPNPHPAIEYVNYHEDPDAVKHLADKLAGTPADESRQTRLAGDRTSGATQSPVVVFATPSRLYGLVNKLDATREDTRSPRDWLAADTTFFDLLAVDEASMMRLPSFALAGGFLDPDAQLLVTGDHRQLAPVRQHDWETETRRTITEYVPYLSTLDYFRALNGTPVADIHGDETQLAGSANLPFYQLGTTYRCHQTVTNFLHQFVYAADGIDYRSDETDLLESPPPASAGLETALNSAAPFVLLIHDERTSQQANPTEAAVSAALAKAVNATASAGIVTPHNAQRGLLATAVPESVEVDTVERYQGGERDAIFVSTTASDPDFLSAERDFILNPNRLNVALSRMKRKLIVVVSKSVFELIPPDVEKYDRARLWKALYQHFEIVDAPPAWRGGVNDFLPDDAARRLPVPSDTTIEIYHAE